MKYRITEDLSDLPESTRTKQQKGGPKLPMEGTRESKNWALHEEGARPEELNLSTL